VEKLLSSGNVFAYLAYGNESFTRMAKLSLHSLLQLGVAREDILVFTDSPTEFEQLGIIAVALEPETISQWSGPLDYPLRCKIMLCIQLRQSHPDRRIILSDADTFWKSLPKSDQTTAFLHCHEPWIPKDCLSGYDAIARRACSQTSEMFNSGLIGLPPSIDQAALERIRDLSDTIGLELTSEIYLSEQYAFSCILSNCRAFTTEEDCILHYWNCSRELTEATRHLTNEEFEHLTEAGLQKFLELSRKLQGTFANKISGRLAKLRRSIRKRKTEFRAFWLRQGRH